MDFVRRETIDLQLVQFFFNRNDKNWNTLSEFTNEIGKLLAFRAVAYDSYTVTEIEGA